MVYKNGYAIDAARHNQLDRRLNGVVNFDPSTHTETDGPCAVTVGSSSSAIESDVDGGTVQINGDRLEVLPDTVSHEAGHADFPRHDIVYIAADGSPYVLTGEPGDNTIFDSEGNAITPTGPSAPVPETQDGRRLEGAVLASVWIPAGATDTSDVSQNDHVHDRRRPAVPIPREAWKEISISGEMANITTNPNYREWGILVPGGHSLQLWSWRQMSNTAEWSSDWNCRAQLVEYTGGDGTVGDNLEIHVSLTLAYNQDDPIARVDVPDSEEYRRFAVRQRAYSHEFAGDERVSFSAQLTIDETDSI